MSKSTKKKTAVKRSSKSERWLAMFDDTPAVIIPGWQIKINDAAMTPLAVVFEPPSGKDKVDGRSLRALAAAQKIVAAPDLYDACKLQRDAIEELFKELGGTGAVKWGAVNAAMVAAQSAIEKAEWGLA